MRRVVWVLGMHRSGTSLTAGVLRLLGADLGPQDGFLPADPNDNPRGYWEQQSVIDLNNKLLERMSGSSVAPPELPVGWAEARALDDLRDEARGILASFDPSAVWAIKDPRLSLTLPFWLPLVDESAAVVCLRAPRDVAASLHKRDPHGPVSRRDWTSVWHRYTADAVGNTRSLPHVTLLYDDWFVHEANYVRLLSELVEGLGQPVRTGALAAVNGFLASELRHHASSLAVAASDPDTVPQARDLYLALRRRTRGRSDDDLPDPTGEARVA